MDDCPEIMLKKLCCTCLSYGRKLFQLCRVLDGVNDLYWLLSHDSVAYREGFYKEAANLFICWECKALLKRITMFREQACVAQKHLTAIADGRNDIKYWNLSLSNLSHHCKMSYDVTITLEDNFVDCNIDTVKSETEEDGPQSVLTNNYLSEDFNMENIDCEGRNEIIKKEPSYDINKVEISVNTNVNEHLTNTVLSEAAMCESKEKIMNSSCVKSQYNCVSCIIGFDSKNDLDKHNFSLHTQKHIKETKTTVERKKKRKNTHMVPKPRRDYPMDTSTALGYLCSECDKYFDNKNQRWKHVQRFHREGFECDHCGKKFAFKNNLTRHVQLHDGPAPRAECTICKKMVRADLMKTHQIIHSTRQKYKCVECDKSFVSRASYEHHLKYTRPHTAVDIFKFKCTTCDKRYRSQRELEDHVNYQHMGRTQHKCPICGKALATKRCITRHVRRAHDGVKESARDKICQQCGKAFRDKKSLREHEYTHTGERPFSCEICGCTFRQSASLYTHKKRVHDIHPKRKTVLLIEQTT